MRKLSFILLSIVNCQLSTASLHASELSNVRSEIAAAKKQDANISGKIKDNEKVVLQTRKELVKTAGDLARVAEEKDSVGEKIRALEKKHGALLAKIREADAHLADAGAALVAIGHHGMPLGSDGSDYALRMAMLGAISERFDADMAVAVSQVRELEKLAKELEKEHGEFVAAEKKFRKHRQELDGLLRARANQNQQLRGQQYELQKKLGDLSEKAKDLTDLANKVAPGSVFAVEPAAGKKLRFPVGGMLLLKFGDYNSLGLKSDGWHVRTRPETIVTAPADGKIEFADYFRRYNRVVIINHDNGYISVMTGMESLNVLVGQDVLAGEPIGLMPDKSPEIYLELRKGTRAVDPGRMFLPPK